MLRPIKYAVGVDIGATFIKSAVVNIRSGKIFNFKTAFSVLKQPKLTEEEIISQIKGQLLFARENFDVKGLRVGIGVPGIVDKQKGIVKFAINIGWKDYELVKNLSCHIKSNIAIESDRNVGLLSEKKYGKLINNKNAIYVSWGSGMGTALLINGKVYRGASERVAELGHTKVFLSSAFDCSCGSKFCLNTFAGTSFIVKHLNELHEFNKPITISTNLVKLINNLDKKQHRRTLKFFEKSLEVFALSLSNIVTVLDPEIVVVGGGMSKLDKKYFNKLNKYFNNYLYPPFRNEVMIVPSAFGRYGGVMGAGVLVAEEFINEKK